MSRCLKRSLCFVLMLLLLLTYAPGSLAEEEQEAPVIRVGYMDHPGFIEKEPDGGFYGYGVEYFDEICKYTGWQVEYVYAPWVEQLEMLERGELDIVPMAQYSAERAERFGYTHQSIGVIQCLLLTLPEEQNGIVGNALACDGRKIGIMRGSRNIELLDQYARQMGFDYQRLEYDYQSDLEAALLSGEIDIIACEQMIETDGLRVLDRFGSDPYYFITAKENETLLAELDYVISQINAYDPTYTAKLYQKYFGEGFMGQTPYFTKDETEFIRSSGAIKVALLSDTKIEAYIDSNGEFSGIIPGIMEKISELSGLNFNYCFIPQGITPLAFLKENPDHIVSGVLASNPAFESEEILLSDVYFTSNTALAVRAENAKDFDPATGEYTVGTAASFQAMHLFIGKNYPNMTIKDYATVEDGLLALERKEIDCFTYTVNVINTYLANPLYEGIVIVDSHFMPCPQCSAGAASPENELLFGIMDKCIAMIPEETFIQLENEHRQNIMYHFNSSDALDHYGDILLNGALLIVGAFAVLVTVMLIRQRKYTRDITLHAEYDMMTGVFNRATLRKSAQHIMEQNAGRGCAVLIVDVDDLQHLNDTRGHDAGDEAIKGIASILKSQFRDSDAIGRIGGDEFGVFLCGVESKRVMVPILVRLHEAISTMVIAGGMAVLSGSIGVAMGTAGEDSLETLCRQADEALTDVKKNGKNGFAFYKSKKRLGSGLGDDEEIADEAEELPPVGEDALLREQVQLIESAACCSVGDSNFRMLLDAFPNLGVYVIEKDTHRVLFFNRRFKKICPRIDIGASCRSLKLGPCQNCIVDTMGERSMAHAIFHSDTFGDEVELTATRIMWEGNTPAILITSWPRTMLTSSDSRLPAASNQDAFDYVTGGLTRAGFIRMMERMKLGGIDLSDYAILFLNIKEFKAVNEMVGCDGGDNLLRTVLTRIEESELHPIISSRKESDHFIFMVEKRALDLSALPELLNFHWRYGGKDLFIHCRCGVFMIDDGEMEIYKMIDRAKLAKEHIVDEYVMPYAVFDQSMLDEYSEKASAFMLFDKGMRNKEFVVYYQPVVDAKTEQIVGAEALVRRIAEDGSIVSPGKFIPMLERTGYISMLDRFVALEVRRFQHKRKNSGLPIIPISFNVSQKDFYDESLMELLVDY